MNFYNKSDFIENEMDLNQNDLFISILKPEIRKKSELLKEISKKLNFPDYFGFNWDALFECLRDFSWIKEKKVVLIHSDLPLETTPDISIYLKILEEAEDDWKNSGEHLFIVYFPIKFKKKITELLKGN